MTTKNKIIKYVSFLLIVAILTPSIVLINPKKASAQWVVFDPANFSQNYANTVLNGTNTSSTVVNTATSLKDWALIILKQALMAVARRVLQEITKSTVTWINQGFHGSPLFVENSSSFFKDIAKSEVKSTIDLFGYDSLRFPFGKDFALNTINAYKGTLANNAAYSLSNVIRDPVYLYNFQNNFNVGGWNGFLINTQYPQNNYLGFQMLATEDLARRVQGTVQTAAQKVQTTLNQGQGFLSPQVCPSNPDYGKNVSEFNKPSFDDAKYNKDHPISPTASEEEVTKWGNDYEAARLAWDKKNDCPGGLVNTTPGSVVSNQITTALGSQFRQTELGAALGNSLSAIFDALLNKFIGDGLSSLASTSNTSNTPDTWNYGGLTLGSPSDTGNNGNSDWASGPEHPIVIADFKKTVQDAINNTTEEIKLMDNNDPNNLGIKQMFNLIWPQTKELDQCLPGPDIGWQDRLIPELSRASRKLQGLMSDNSPQTADPASRAFNELNLAVDSLKNWISGKMATSLPGASTYLDAINGLEDIYQQSTELINDKKTRTDALLRLQSINEGLNLFQTQPTPGSTEEASLIDLQKQYDTISSDISTTFSMDDTRNKLSVAKDKSNNLNKLIIQCSADRASHGWTVPGGANSMFGSSSTEQNYFCGAPIIGGYSHQAFVNTGVVAYPEIPLVNTVLNINGNSIPITLDCGIIYNASVSDYRKDLPY